MEQKDNTIPFEELNAQRLEDITKRLIQEPNFMLDKLNKQFIDKLNNDRKESQYTKEEVLQMRTNNDNRLYKATKDVNSLCGYVWENGKSGYFRPFEHRGLGYDFIQPHFGGGQKDGKGLRFIQTHKDSSKSFAFSQSNDIIISGFGEYVLENWGKDLPKLCETYTCAKLNKAIKQWEMDNYPTEITKDTIIQLLKDLELLERKKWKKSTIADFFTSKDNESLSKCMDVFFEWVDKFCKECETPQATLKSQNKGIGKKKKSFSDKLHHTNKAALMTKLHELLDKETSGREVAKVLEALQTKSYLFKKSYTVPEVITEFDIKCSKEAINKHLNKKVWDNPTTQNELQQIIDILP